MTNITMMVAADIVSSSTRRSHYGAWDEAEIVI